MFNLSISGIKVDQGIVFLILFLVVPAILLLHLKFAKWSRLPPGPVGIPILGCLPFLDRRLHRYFAALAATYGPVVSLRLGTKLCLVLSSPAAAKEVLKDKDTIFANRDVPAVARATRLGPNDLLWAPYGPRWRILRKLSVHEILGAGSLESVRSLRRREVRRTVAGVRSLAGEPVEVPELMFLTSLNVMTSMLWGLTVDGGDIGRELREVIEKIIELIGTPNISDFLPALEPLDLQGLGKRTKQLVERYEGLLKRASEERSRLSAIAAAAAAAAAGPGDPAFAGKKTLMQVMVELLERRDPKVPLTMDNVGGLLLNMVGGGTDTTATTVEWAMAELLNNPEMLRKVQAELDNVVGRDRIVEESDLPNLVYLDAVFKETLRLHPVLPLLVPHSSSSPCVISGYTIPEGTQVIVNVWAIHRDPSNWPEDPLKFKPERFLQDQIKYDYSGNNFSYIPFGSGRRICAGIALGERMVMYMLASLLHSFDWRLPDGGGGDGKGEVAMTEKFGIVMKKSIPLRALPVPRLDKAELYSMD